MYRALIVEDEDLMREYLASRLSLLHPEWQATATACDGMEAVERMAHEQFDAVISDIRMPGMDGLELARYIRRTNADMPILIVSGYDEFDYARTAMRLNVFDYLLKPLNEDELAAALAAITVLVSAERTSTANDLLAAALSGELAATERLHERLNHQPLGLLLLSVALSANTTARAEQRLALQAAAEQTFAPLCARLPQGMAVLCPATDAILVETACRNAAQHFSASHADIPIRSGYAIPSAASLSQAMADAAGALQLALALDEPLLSPNLLYQQRLTQDRLAQMLQELNISLTSGILPDERIVTLIASLNEFPAQCRQSAAIWLLTECLTDETTRATALAALQGKEPVAILWQKALRCLFAPATEPSRSAYTLVQQARDYLNLHFAEPISLTLLAEHVGVTAAYLSSIFHQEMELSYSQYLLQLRMEDAARRLLSSANTKIYDIGEAVGFPSSKHFAHVFRQYFGLSPSEYREKRGGKV